MDIKTLLAGYRPLLPSEYAQKLSVLERAHARYAEAGGQDDFESFLASVPKELLSQFFGSEAMDAYVTYNLSLLNTIQPITDVFLTAVLHNIVMMLTYQGRFIGRSQFAEVAVLVGENAHDFCNVMLNGNGVNGIAFFGEAAVEGLEAKYAHLFGQEGVVRPPRLIGFDGFGEWLEASVLNVGLVALLDGGDPQRFNSALAQAVSRISPNTYVCLSAELDRVLPLVGRIASEYPAVDLSVRIYACNTPAGPREKAVIVCTGVPAGFSIQLDAPKPLEVTFASVTLQDERGNANFQVVNYAQAFTGKVGHERIEIKPPVVLKSTSPLPVYTRELIEKPVLTRYRAARVKDAGIVHSRDVFHATYLYVTKAGEVLTDFLEMGQYELTPVFKTAEGEGHRRQGRLDRGHVVRHRGQIMPLCFAPTAHTYHSHFLLQCFPRVLLAREEFPDVKFAVPWDLRKYQREMLHMVGITEDRLIPIYPETTVYGDELIIPELWPAIFTRFTERIYSEMMEKVGGSGVKPHRRILISREARTQWRNMVNYNVVKDILATEFGFDVVSPDKLSLADEINLFKESAIIAGAEGAGLYNCCFATSESAVLNMADQDYVMYIVGSMAQIRGFDVGYVFGDSFQADSDLKARAGHTDFIIDPQALRVAARRLIDHMQSR